MTNPDADPDGVPGPFHLPQAIRRCRRCTLPVDPAIVGRHVIVDRDGTCNFCRAHDRRFGRAAAPPSSKKRLDREIERAMRLARKRRYDALVPISGGKDSLTVLHYLRTNYPDLRILAVTCHNGFHSEVAMEACVSIARQLGVEHRVWRPPHMIDLARLFLQRTGHFCAPCEVDMMNMGHRLTLAEGIPIAVLGTSRRYDGAQPEVANPWSPPFFEAVLRGVPGAEELRRDVCDPGLMVRAGWRNLTGRLGMLLLPDFIDWNAQENRETLASRYGIVIGGEHSDCLGAPVADWLYKRRCGYGQKAAGLAASVRNGLLPRSEALARLAAQDEFGQRFPEEAAREFLQRIGMTADEVVACSSIRPDAYFNASFRVFGWIRKRLGLSVA